MFNKIKSAVVHVVAFTYAVVILAIPLLAFAGLVKAVF